MQPLTTADLARVSWLAMSRRRLPRNVAAISRARARRELDELVVSFVGPTCIGAPHVFVDSATRYDFRFALDLPTTIVLRPGIDARVTVADLFNVSRLYPTVVDFDKQLVGSVVEADASGFRIWPRRVGSQPWTELFGD